MLKQKAQLETSIGNNLHVYQCENNTSLKEVYEALSVFRSYIYGRMKEAEEQPTSTEVKEDLKSE